MIKRALIKPTLIKSIFIKCLWILVFEMSLGTLMAVFPFSFASAEAIPIKRTLNTSQLPEDIKNEISEKMPKFSSSSFTLSDVDFLIQHLMKTDRFKTVEVTCEDDNTLSREVCTVHAARIQKIKSLSIKGANAFSESDLTSIFGVASGSSYDEVTIAAGIEKLNIFYSSNGYLQTKINYNTQVIDNSNINLALEITEGTASLVKEFVIETQNQELKAKLTSFLASKTSIILNEANLATIQKEAREFLSKNRYFRADISNYKTVFNDTKTEVKVVWSIENPERYKLIIENNVVYSTPQLLEWLDLDNFFTTAPNPSGELAQKLKVFYYSKGYARAQIRIEEKARAEFDKEIRLIVNEGARIRWTQIDVVGRISRPPEYYRNLILRNSSEIVTQGWYIKDSIETAWKKTLVDLQDEGFLQARVISSRTQYNKTKDGVAITLNLDELDRTIVKSIEFVGNSGISTAELLTKLDAKIGEPIRLNSFEASIQAIKYFYRNKGYLEMTLLNEGQDLVRYDSGSTAANLYLNIHEGPQIIVGSILIEGNALTKESVFLKELEFKVGDILTPSALEESINRLQRLGFFNSVDIRTLEEKSSVSHRTIVVKVTERNPGTFNFGAGINNEREMTIRGFTGISYRNLGGVGRGLSARGELNYNIAGIRYPEFKITGGFLEPYLFGTRSRGRANLTRSQTVTDYEKQVITEATEIVYTIEQNVTSHVLASWDIWQGTRARDFRIDNSAPEISQDIVTTGPNVEIDYRDHPFNPTSGTFTRFALEYSDPDLGSSKTIKFWKSTAATTGYVRIPYRTWIWANSLRGGWLQNLSHDPEGGVPYNKKGFLLGGSTTIRGYQSGTQERFPNDSDLGSENFLLKTWANYLLLKTELRFPLFSSFSGALFYDGGSVQVGGLDFSDPWRDAIGVGLRFATPVGPVNFELGYKLDRKPERREDPWGFHFSIGTF